MKRLLQCYRTALDLQALCDRRKNVIYNWMNSISFSPPRQFSKLEAGSEFRQGISIASPSLLGTAGSQCLKGPFQVGWEGLPLWS